MRSRNELIGALTNYRPSSREESEFVPRFLQLLQHPRAFHRDHLPGHMTGSAWIVNQNCEVLLTHHAKLNRWLQPGGHADGEEDILGVALREVREETGLKELKVAPGIFDIDIHTIPRRNDFPEHLHYDIRFLMTASTQEQLSVTPESHALSWVKLEDLADISAQNKSMLLMGEKSRVL